MLVTVGQLLQISELGLLPSLFPNETLVTDMDNLRFGMPRKTTMTMMVKIYLSRLFRMLSTGLDGLYMFCLKDVITGCCSHSSKSVADKISLDRSGCTIWPMTNASKNPRKLLIKNRTRSRHAFFHQRHES